MIKFSLPLSLFTLASSLLVSSPSFALPQAKQQRCDANAITVDRVPTGETYQHGGVLGVGMQTREIIVELRASRECQTNWVRADVPKGTRLYLEDRQGMRFAEAVTGVNGSSYGDTVFYGPSETPYKGCATLPNGRTICTEFR
ncbi:MAG: hypothetical protein HC820_08110 [Hydrococcus sp. RM1_1_31]|nr:hypothetical protein [Hydrococcus sp. RM1_1_31]